MKPIYSIICMKNRFFLKKIQQISAKNKNYRPKMGSGIDQIFG